MMDYDITVKTILIGDSSVGKSSLLYRYTDNDWNPYYIATIGVDFKVSTMERNNRVVKHQLWDTAGQERFRSITQSYYKGANAIAVVFDVNDRDSFEGLRVWLNDVNTFGAINVPVILIGNKCDYPAEKRVVPHAEALTFANSYGFKYFETSAKTGANVQEAFEALVDMSVGQREKLVMEGRRRGGVVLPSFLEEQQRKQKEAAAKKDAGNCAC